MIRAVAIDDEPPALKVVENFCRRTDLVTIDKTFTRPHDALKHLHNYPVDLLFLDIQMPSLSGIDFYKSVSQDVMVIFTTAYSNYAVEGFNLSAVDYLLKPFTFERFMQAVNRANEYYTYKHQSKTEAPQYLFIRADYSLVKVALKDILYIEGLDDYLKIYTGNDRPLVARMTMKAMLEKLPANDFIRVHRSFIIPFQRIKNVRNKVISMGQIDIPIGISYEKAFFELFKA